MEPTNEVYESGYILINLGESCPVIMETLCRKLNGTARGRAVFDWGFIGGQAQLIYMGDYKTAVYALKTHISWYNYHITNFMRKEYPEFYERIEVDLQRMYPPSYQMFIQ
jgi:hypothetical protein